jgi:hypothetical protein
MNDRLPPLLVLLAVCVIVAGVLAPALGLAPEQSLAATFGMYDFTTFRMYDSWGMYYDWTYPNSPAMGSWAVSVSMYNTRDLPQYASIYLAGAPESWSGIFLWDPGWTDTIYLDGQPGRRTGTWLLPGGATQVHQYNLTDRWNWIEPWEGGSRLIDISMGLLLAWPGLQTAGLTYTTVQTLKTLVPHVGEVTYRFQAVGGDAHRPFQVVLSVPWSKYMLYGESVLAGILGGELTTAGIAALAVPGLGWAAAGPLFAGEAVEIGIGEGAYIFAVDPDPNYTQIAQFELITVPAVQNLPPGPGRQGVIAALDALSYLRAAQASYARYQGAEEAGDAAWVATQLELTKSYLSQAASLSAQSGSLLGPVIASVPAPSPQAVADMRSWLATNGLPQIEVDVLGALGFSQAEITEITQAVANMPDAVFTQFPDAAQVFANMADGLASAGAGMPIPPSNVVPCQVNLDPDTLQIGSKGNPVTCYIGVPTGRSVSDIVVSSLSLQGLITPPLKSAAIRDYNHDKVLELMVQFSRQSLVGMLTPGERIIVLTGEFADGTPLTGSDTIQVIQ